MLIKQAATFSTIWKLTSLRNKSRALFTCQNDLSYMGEQQYHFVLRLQKITVLGPNPEKNWEQSAGTVLQAFATADTATL